MGSVPFSLYYLQITTERLSGLTVASPGEQRRPGASSRLKPRLPQRNVSSEQKQWRVKRVDGVLLSTWVRVRVRVRVRVHCSAEQ